MTNGHGPCESDAALGDLGKLSLELLAFNVGRRHILELSEFILARSWCKYKQQVKEREDLYAQSFAFMAEIFLLWSTIFWRRA